MVLSMKCAACRKEIKNEDRAVYHADGRVYHPIHEPVSPDPKEDLEIASIYAKIAERLDGLADAKIAIDIALRGDGDAIAVSKEAFRNIESKWRTLAISYEQAKTIADRVGFGSLRIYVEAQERVIKYASAEVIRGVAAGYRSRVK